MFPFLAVASARIGYLSIRSKLPTMLALATSPVVGLSLGSASTLRTVPAQRTPACMMVDSWYDAGSRLGSPKMADEAPAAEAEAEAAPEFYYCNDQGCWIGEPPPLKLPDGRTIEACDEVGVALGKVVPVKRKPAQVGIFAPVVGGAKAVMGEKELNKLRGQVIAEHSKVIAAFVDTSDSQFGQIVLKQLFEAADKDGNGTLDRQEVKDALHALGFTFVQDKQLDTIFARGDDNGDEVRRARAH